MTIIGPKLLELEVRYGNITDTEYFEAQGHNDGISTTTDPEDITSITGGEITGFDATAGEAIEVLAAAAANAGTVLSSGTATGGSATTIIDTGATFVTDGVAVGDLIINDTKKDHGIVSEVTSETTLTVVRMSDASVNASGDAYRVVTTNGTGVACVKLEYLLESDYAGYISEYVVTNGTTGVNTSGSDYIRCGSIRAVLAGSSGACVTGVLARQATTTANIFCEIDDARNRSFNASGTIPAGKTFYCIIGTQMSRASGAAGSSQMFFLQREIGAIWDSVLEFHVTDSKDYITPRYEVFQIKEYTDFKVRCYTVSDDNTVISAQVLGFFKDN